MPLPCSEPPGAGRDAHELPTAVAADASGHLARPRVDGESAKPYSLTRSIGVANAQAVDGGITIRDYPLLILRVSIHDAAQSFDQLRLAKGLLHNGGSLCGRFRDEP